MSPILAPVTIIPPELYVERAADRQIREIVEGMGRPGYILVARQMGKTNLLLNARRSLEKDDLLFVYIDLSTKIDSLEGYFALLLNTAHAIHPDLFASLPLTDFPRDQYSSASFENILRLVLRSFKGRLVFVLDEIDSLANYSFSDRVFSQIRSLYFSRTNFPEYLRVTYVLSGVAEPVDLIKDKNVSPFNIGQKIFLNDFTEQEFDLFLLKAKMNLSPSIRERIYHWAGGNPRITWDVCSEVEKISGTETLTTLRIDEIVSTLYLRTFDRAPVDHIRTLAQSDRDIRSAVKALRANQPSEISDKVRSKLYLAGITSMQSRGTDSVVLRIKNRIIDETLSDRWLLDVEKQSKNILQLARENYEEKLFEPAVAFFEEYLSNHEIDPNSIDAYRLAIAYFSTRRHLKAIEWLTKYSAHSESEEIRSDVFFMVGRCQLVLGNYDKAAQAFREVLSIGHRQFLAVSSGLLASSLIQSDIKAHQDEIRNLCESALKLAANDQTKSERTSNARVVALLNLASLEDSTDNREKALELLELAENEQSAAYKPIIALTRLKLLSDGKRKSQLLDELTDCVIRAASAPLEQKMDGSIRSVALSALIVLRLNNRRKEFGRLLTFLIETGETTPQDLPSLYFSLYELASKSPGEASVFLKDLIERFEDEASATETVLTAMRALLLAERDRSVVKSYIAALDKLSRTEVAFSDTDNFALGNILSNALALDDLEQLVAIDPVASHATLHATYPTIGHLFFSYFEMLRLERLGRILEAVETARRVLRWLINTRSGQSFREESRRAMQERTQKVIDIHAPPVGVRNEFKSIGRNTKVRVIYSDGRKLETKFKLVQRDLALGNCKME